MDRIVPSRWQRDVIGSSITSMKVGGPLEYFSRPKTVTELLEDLSMAQEMKLSFRIIGAGSDILFHDDGFKGLIIQPALAECRVLSSDEIQKEKYDKIIQFIAEPRYKREEKEAFLDLGTTVQGEESDYGYVQIDAGVPWGQAVMWSLTNGFIGLHWYARIPCFVGGAVFNNIHGEKHLLSEVVVGVWSITPGESAPTFIPVSELELGYDHSRFHHTKEIILSVVLRLHRESTEVVQAAKQQYLQWTHAKTAVQPSGANAGSVFQNITPEQAKDAGQEMLAAAYYVDHGGLRGEQCGGMQVYPTHGNFIVNLGGGTQADFIQLVERVRAEVLKTYGVRLEPEVECITETGERHVWQTL